MREGSAEVSGKAVPCANCGVKHRSLTSEECQDRQMSEETLRSRVTDRAKRRKWVVAHAGRGQVGAAGFWVTPMFKGWPDLFLMNPDHVPPVIAIELKRELGDLEPEQLDCLDLLNRCGIPAVVVRPSDLRLHRVNAILS